MSIPDAAKISAMLADRIEPLCWKLLPNGRAEFGNWRVGSLNGEPGGSLSIKLRHRPGQWSDFATGEKGDALGLVKAVLGCDMAEALRWSRQWLGIENPTNGCQRPPMDAAARRKREAERAAREARERAEDARRRDFALDLFDEAVDAHGTATERYLAERRLELPPGCDTIRHHPRCVFRPGERVQCMVVLFRHNLTDEALGIQRTRLPLGGWRRGMKMERLNLGQTAGGSIKLDHDRDVLRALAIGEGTETVLAGRMFGHTPAWATGGKGTVRNFPVIPRVQRLSVHWESDADADVRHCLERWSAAGRSTFILRPRFGKDAADAVLELAS
jgi:Toprim domain